MRKNLLFFVALFCILNATAQDSWTQKANFPGNARWGAAIFTINGKIYVGTGYDGNTNYSDFYEYDPSTNQWTQKASINTARRLASAFTINGKGYISCGLSASGHLNDLLEYDPTTNNWTAKASLPDDERYGAAGFAIGNKGYVCCGNEGTAGGPYSNDLWEYNPTTNSWTAKSNFPGNARYGMTNARFVIGTKAYTGCGVTQSSHFTDMYSYDQQTNQWTQIANFPGSGSSYPMGFAICDAGFMGTGQNGSGTAYSDLYQYSPSTNNWTQVTGFGGGIRWLLVSAEVNDRAFVGTGDDFNNQFSDWWEYKCLNDGIFDEENNKPLTVYPNPTSNVATLDLTQIKERSCTVSVFDFSGKLISSEELNKPSEKGKYTIDLSSYSNGLYFIQVNANEINYMAKVVKM